MKSTISFLHTKSILTYETSLQKEKNTKNFCKFVKYLHGTIRDSLLALFRKFQTGEFANLIGCRKSDVLRQRMRLQICFLKPV